MVSNSFSSVVLSKWFGNKEVVCDTAEQAAAAQQPCQETVTFQTGTGFWTGNTPAPHRQCTGMTEFIHTYIHPRGQHADGMALSDIVQQQERELAAAVDGITSEDSGNNKVITARRVKPFRLNGVKSIMVGFLCLLASMNTEAFPVFRRQVSCHPTDNPADIGVCQQYRFEGRKLESYLCTPIDDCERVRQLPDASFAVTSSHSVCKRISHRNDMRSESERLDKWFRSQLTKEVSEDLQEKIVADYQSMRFDRKHQPDSNVSLILSGGTRATAQLTKENHLAYARFRGINYRFVYPFEFQKELGTGQLYWMKVFALKNALECESVPSGQWVVWLDDDIVIDDFAGERSMLDRYIRQFGHADIFVAGDNRWALTNTGIVMVRKTERARSFMHLWSFLSNDHWMGYQPQEHTLHEQEALKKLLIPECLFEECVLVGGLRFDKMIQGLVQIVPNRDRTNQLNLNTYKREEFIKQQPWYHQDMNIAGVAEESQQGYEDGDSFIHHGGRKFRTRIIVESLQHAVASYKKHIVAPQK